MDCEPACTSKSFPPQVVLAVVFIITATKKSLDVIMNNPVAFHKVLPKSSYNLQWARNNCDICMGDYTSLQIQHNPVSARGVACLAVARRVCTGHVLEVKGAADFVPSVTLWLLVGKQGLYSFPYLDYSNS